MTKVPPVSERDLIFTGADFRRIRDLVYQHAGIALSDAKTDMAYSRLARRVRAMGEKRFSVYLDSFASDPHHPEWQLFINALTTNLTAFFREPHHFAMLSEHYARTARTGAYRVWCAAVSSGEEAYSAAMTLSDTLAGAPAQFEILATDIDTQMLSIAAEGVYTLERVAQVAQKKLKAHFQKGRGAFDGMARVKASLRANVRFTQLNLIADRWPDIGEFDAVFCRNVMIYFDSPTQSVILSRLALHLKPDGLLFLGHSENIQHLTDDFVTCGRTTYRRRLG